MFSAFGFTGVITRVMLSQRSEHVDGFGVPGVFDGAVGSVFGGVEWQWRKAGSEAWWMVLATHPLSGCTVSGVSEEGQFVEWVVGCARKVRGQSSGIEGCRAVWLGELKGMSLMCRFSG